MSFDPTKDPTEKEKLSDNKAPNSSEEVSPTTDAVDEVGGTTALSINQDNLMLSLLQDINAKMDIIATNHEALEKKVDGMTSVTPTSLSQQPPDPTVHAEEPMNVDIVPEKQETSNNKSNAMSAEIRKLAEIVGDMVTRNDRFLPRFLLEDFNLMKSSLDEIAAGGDKKPENELDMLQMLHGYKSQLESMMEDMVERSKMQDFVDRGAFYISHKDDFNHFINSQPGKKIYIFFFNWENTTATEDLWSLFETLLQYKSEDKSCTTQCALLEMGDANNTACIKTYLNGKCICDDLLKEMQEVHKNSTAFATKYEKGRGKPERKTHFETPCPLAARKDSGCPNKDVSWLCTKCMVQIEYGFDGHLYCKCGSGRVEDFSFHCNSEAHRGLPYESYDKTAISDIVNNLRSFNGLTILILGETGVGKSTFINGFANYMQYETLEEARMAETLLSPVKSSFVITDENMKQITVSTGKEKNECHGQGQSATQGTKAHVFSYKGSKNVRLIDTPGIGDTRGIEQDRQNFQNILSYISYFEEIHGICILLKPNNSRLTAMFQFCIKELLIHLHKSAANNIVFCFTNARNTNYRPGDTAPTLQKLLEENKNVPLELKKETVFCIDNECFRYLAAVKHGITFPEEDNRVYEASWEKARAETTRLMNRISELKAHKVKDTISINDVRRRILDLTKPLAEIANHISNTISVIEDKKKEISTSRMSASDMMKMINIKVSTLEHTPLNHPRTVCTSPSCSETSRNLNGQNVQKFNVFCHEHCHLSGVQTDIINNPDLQQCSAMAGSGGQTCSKCGCSWNIHMHVTYDLVPIEVDGEDENAKKSHQDITSQINLKEAALAGLEQKVQELTSEKEQIIKASAQFGMFLKANSVMPYNDAMIAYLDYMIKAEEDKATVSGDRSKVNSLRKTKKMYEEEINIIINAVNTKGSGGSAKDQDTALQDLFKMKHFGANIMKILKNMENAKDSKVAFEESHYDIKTSGASVVSGVKSEVSDAVHYVTVQKKKAPTSRQGRKGKPYTPLQHKNKDKPWWKLW